MSIKQRVGIIEYDGMEVGSRMCGLDREDLTTDPYLFVPVGDLLRFLTFHSIDDLRAELYSQTTDSAYPDDGCVVVSYEK